MPCNDVAVEQLNTNKNFSYVINNTKEDSHSANDSCSPLCFCNCCRITASEFKFVPILDFGKEVKTYFSKKIHFQKNDFAYLLYDRIWQPPKI
ncbi:hypothetical protein ASG22_00700 [Chryseobacterium sp. Leaf405]|nr:hypothetical protein ASG22_00700 [Chryseobacterium sp. Leaf405]